MTGFTFAQLAGVSALVAATMTVVGMATLLAFFSRGGRWGTFNDAASVVLMLAMIPVARFESVVAPLSELGVVRVVPISTDRSTVATSTLRAGRMQRIAFEAAAQSRRARPLVVAAPRDARDILARADCVVCDHGGAPVSAVLARVATDAGEVWVATGPEGGWSERELAAGGVAMRLSSYVLRAETAPVAAAAVLAEWLAE